MANKISRELVFDTINMVICGSFNGSIDKIGSISVSFPNNEACKFLNLPEEIIVYKEVVSQMKKAEEGDFVISHKGSVYLIKDVNFKEFKHDYIEPPSLKDLLIDSGEMMLNLFRSFVRIKEIKNIERVVYKNDSDYDKFAGKFLRE